MKLMERLKARFEEHKPKQVVQTLASLLEANLITKAEYDVFVLFSVEERGQLFVKRMVEDTFMDQAPPELFTGEMLAYSEGRRSVIRDIKLTITKINQLLRGDYDN